MANNYMCCRMYFIVTPFRMTRFLRKIVARRVYKLKAAGITPTTNPTKLIAVTNAGSAQQVSHAHVRNFVNRFGDDETEFCEKIEMPWNKSYSICRVNSENIAGKIINATQNQKYKLQGNSLYRFSSGPKIVCRFQWE